MAQHKRAAKSEPGPVVLRDPRAIKALAHPARLAVLEELFAGRELTATECADIAGLSPSAMSYHLRALEKWGIVERAAASADGRERPWRASGKGLRVESAEPQVTAVAESALVTRLLDRTRKEVVDWVGRDAEAQGRWRDITTIANSARWLTDEEAEELAATVDQVLDKYRQRKADDRPEGSRRVRVSFVMVPTDQA